MAAIIVQLSQYLYQELEQDKQYKQCNLYPNSY